MPCTIGLPHMVLSLFRSLLPRDERFVERFCAHSGLIVRAAHLERLARRPGAGPLESATLAARALELRADAHALLNEVSQLSSQVAA